MEPVTPASEPRMTHAELVARAPGPQGRGGARGKGAAVTRWLLVLAAWVALELVVLYGGAWLAHKVVPPWAFSPTLLLNFVLLVGCRRRNLLSRHFEA
jgi:hypothetical protein